MQEHAVCRKKVGEIRGMQLGFRRSGLRRLAAERCYAVNTGVNWALHVRSFVDSEFTGTAGNMIPLICE